MWWQRGAVLTLPFNLRAANLHRTTFKKPLLRSTATRRSTLSSLLIKLGQHIRAGWDVTARRGDLWKGKRRDGENISLHRRFKRRSPGIGPIFTPSSSNRLTDTQTEARAEKKEQNGGRKEQREFIFSPKYIRNISKSDAPQNKNRYGMASLASLFVIKNFRAHFLSSVLFLRFHSSSFPSLQISGSQ